jgi:uncharacterized protein YbjT (DUF2867 family)
MGAFFGSVVVTGATGETGALVVQQLKAAGIAVRAVVRNPDKARDLLGADTDIAVADVTDRAALERAFGGATALIIASSAKPMMTGMVDGRPQFAFPADGMPEQIDYHGQIAQTDAAIAQGIEHVIVIGSMGMSDPDANMLNKMADGKILTWKLKGEEYLRASGLAYTCVRPGGLVNEPGGQQTIVAGHNDELSGRIARADVAAVCVAALSEMGARDKVFDIVAQDGPPTTDWAAFFATT